MSRPADQGAAGRSILAEWLRWAGAVAIAGIAVTRCVIAFAPRVVFDIDPAVDPSPLPGLGPAGSLLLDALMLAACGMALLGEALARRGVSAWLLGLAIAPAAIVAWHACGDSGDLWRGSTWVAAAAACATAAHLGRDTALRNLILALLVAVLVPVLLRGTAQMSVSVLGWSLRGPEYDDLIREFETGRDAFFADRGWTPETPAALVYERRLRQPDPRGWFPTVNLFASLMAFGTVLLAGLAIAAARQRARAPAFGAALAAAAAAAVMLFAGSKGAVLSAAAGLVLVAAPLAGPRVRGALGRHGGTLAMGLVAGALLAVVVRGVVLPEAWLGERSLLFRWHYLAGSARVIADHGLLGTGPDGFQTAYLAVRDPRSPEEVRSALNVFADWAATLGVAGAAWAAMLLLLTWRAGKAALSPEAGEGAATAKAPLAAAALVAVAGLMPALTVEAANLDALATQVSRAAGVIGFVAAVAALCALLARLRAAAAGAALGAAAIALVVHGQIEMTFFDPGSAVWVLCMVGLAGGAPAPAAGARPSAGLLWGGALIALGVLLAIRCVRAFGAERVMIDAAREIHAATADRRLEALARQRASDSALAAYEDLPADVGLLEEAARQRAVAARLSEAPAARQLLDEAVALSDRAVGEHDKASLVFLAADLWRARAHSTGDPADWDVAIERAWSFAAIDPHGISPWTRLGDALWDAGRRDEAAEAYRRALENDAQHVLDPLSQMPEPERERIRERSAP